MGEHVSEQVSPDDHEPTITDGQRALAEREFGALAALAASDGDVTPETLLEELGELLWTHAGILRNDAGAFPNRATRSATRSRKGTNSTTTTSSDTVGRTAHGWRHRTTQASYSAQMYRDARLR